MENHGKQLEVNGWAMIAHASRRTPEAKWELSISSIRKGNEYVRDWDDADGCYATEEDAYKAAEKWARKNLS